MHITQTSMPVPLYVPPPYKYSTLKFDQLPLQAQAFLINSGLHLLSQSKSNSARESALSFYDADMVEQTRVLRAQKLFRTVEGVHMALVERRREVVALITTATAAVATHLGHVPSDIPQVAAIEARIREISIEVEHILLPEWRAHLNEFMSDFDALVWIDVNARKGTLDAVSAELELAYRAARAASVLAYVGEALVALDAAVVGIDVASAMVEKEKQAIIVLAGMEKKTERKLKDFQNASPTPSPAREQFPRTWRHRQRKGRVCS